MIRTYVLKATQPKSLLGDLNRESGRIYTDVVVTHWRAYRKSDVWLSCHSSQKLNDFLHPETILHAHSRDAAQEGFYKAVKTTHTLRKQGIRSRFPHHRKLYRTSVWKSTGIRIRGEQALLARSHGLTPIVVRLPESLREKKIVEVRLVFNQKSHRYEWHFVADDLVEIPLRTEGCVVAVDLGEIHPAACTNGVDSVVDSCRALRSNGQGLAKSIAGIDAKKSRTKPGSIQNKRLSKAKNKKRRLAESRQKDILHKVSRDVVNYAVRSGAKEIVIGDVRNIAKNGKLSKASNQKISLWPHGKLRSNIEYKAAEFGIATTLIGERNTTQTCPCCGEKQKPRGRVYKCKSCGWSGHRDGQVGAANILSLRLFNELARVLVSTPKYRHPFLSGNRQRQASVDMRTPCKLLI